MINFGNPVFGARRERLKNQLSPGDVAIVAASKEKIRNRDCKYPFRQNSNFLYLTGLNEPDAILIIEKSSPGIIFVREKNLDLEIWTGEKKGLEGAKSDLSIGRVVSVSDYKHCLLEILQKKTKVLFPFDCEYSQFIVDNFLKVGAKASNYRPTISLIEDLNPIIHSMRVIKSPLELTLMMKAAEISSESHCKAMQILKPGLSEDQLASVIEHNFRILGARDIAYETIVGGGENACILHYTERKDYLNNGDLVLVDSGCEFNGYASDITRTYPVSGKFTSAQSILYDLVLEAQEKSIEALRSGNRVSEYHDIAVYTLTEGLIKLGLLDGPVCKAIKEQSYKAFYMHGTGHWLGLDVHDVGSYSEGGKPVKLCPGMVVTCEPGLYISSKASVPEEFRGIGIRIEDNILVTDDDPFVFTSKVPKTRESIENLMANK